MNQFKIGLIQMDVGMAKEKNVTRAVRLIGEAAEKGAEVIVLPEMFNCPYDTKCFPAYAEMEGEYTWNELSKAALKNEAYIVGGSIPEKDHKGKIYNTSYSFNRKGEQIGRHRKMHLFDIAIEGGQVFKESDTLSAGNEITMIDTEFCKMGIAICYDIRFPELSRLMALKGAKVIVVTAAFNMTTGPVHWELIFRSRALDNQVFMAGAAPARNDQASYTSYANSILVSPWGAVIDRLDDKEGILIGEIDLDKLDKIRSELPLLLHRRTDIYSIKTV